MMMMVVVMDDGSRVVVGMKCDCRYDADCYVSCGCLISSCFGQRESGGNW
jgi:hypothetical protein